MNFNPNTPDTLGLELRPTVEADVVLTSPVNGQSVKFTAQATETIEQCAIFLPTVNELAVWELEVYNVASTPNLGIITTVCLPTQDARNTNAWAQFDDASGNNSVDIWQAIDSYPDVLFRGAGAFFNSGVPIDNDELIYPQYGQSLDYAARFGSVIGVAANKQITSVRLKAYCQEYIDIAFVAGMSITPYLLIAGVPYYADKVAVPEQSGGYLVTAEWNVNPATGCSWVNADLDQFDDLTVGSTSGAGWLVDATGSSNNLATILQAWLEIDTTNDAIDVRYAKGCLEPNQPGWWTFDLVDPTTGVLGWSKTATFDMIATLRRRSAKGRIGWRYLAGDIGASHMESHDIDFQVETQLLRSIGDASGKAFAFILIDDLGNVSQDSQPYASADGDYQFDLGIERDWSRVSTTQTLTQEFTTVGADTYAWVRIMARLESGVATEPLTVKVVNGANVQQGVTITFQPTDLVSPRTEYQMLEGTIGPTALSAATQYRFVIESAAAVDEGWHVQVLSPYPDAAANTPAGAGDATFGGTTDALTVGVTRWEELDAVVTIATQPTAPAGFAGVTTVGTEVCDEFVTLSWTATDVSADAGFFLQYEIDYSSDGGVTWERIREITDELVETTEHHEAKRNTLASYRIRVRRTDYSASDWSATVTATPIMTCCGYILTTDAAPALTYWVDYTGPDNETEPLQRVSMQQYHGRDHSVGHHNLEWQGLTFTRTLVIGSEGIVAGNNTPNATGLTEEEVFANLLAFLPSKGSDIPYICLLDQDGNRWFVSMELGRWMHSGFGNVYMADAKFTTVTDVPFPFDAVV